jgi:hypothetical protein
MYDASPEAGGHNGSIGNKEALICSLRLRQIRSVLRRPAKEKAPVFRGLRLLTNPWRELGVFDSIDACCANLAPNRPLWRW